MVCIYFIVFRYFVLYILLLNGLVSFYDLVILFMHRFYLKHCSVYVCFKSIYLVTSFWYICSCCIYCIYCLVKVFIEFIGAE